jgi:nicotinamidase-related amidase
MLPQFPNKRMEYGKEEEIMNDRETTIPTLEEALKQPCKHRNKELAMQPMDNYSETPGGPHKQPLSFWASWDLKDRPRRIALLLDDCQEEYRPYAGGILPNLIKLVDVFRTARSGSDGVCIMWSAWTRRFDDGILNAMDRWYGPKGLRPDNPQNAIYVYTGAPGMEPLSEIAPSEKEISNGWFYHGKHLDMFWNFDENGNSYLDEKLKAVGIDTIVLTGLWTDECILSTAYAGNSRGYDVVVVSDAVATATANQETALTVARSTVAKVLPTDEVISYMENDFVTGKPGAVKGTTHPDGRKDD